MNEVHMRAQPANHETFTPRPVHTLLSETHRAEAAVNRREAAHLIRVLDDVKLHPESTELKAQLSAALLAVADARERLALSLTGEDPSRQGH